MINSGTVPEDTIQLWIAGVAGIEAVTNYSPSMSVSPTSVFLKLAFN